MKIIVAALIGVALVARAVGRPDWAAICIIGAFFLTLGHLLNRWSRKSCTDESHIEFLEN